ncbi:MaoC/PaaZ C-terminal domain-containing protein [Paucibacter sp. O1-1]|nr:MaoC/PaaZ C-terminal domain-containing protein [Paucibacter sp. O1-1]MDA3825057.1 MaoC/PaaZ C-terminal domain-containing protein [Paucibacter sp. O1-1]
MNNASFKIGPFDLAALRKFGELHGTNGKIHTDPVFADASPTQGIVVQGTLVMAAIISAANCLNAHKAPKETTYDAKFVAMVRLGEVLNLEFSRAEQKSNNEGEVWDYTCSRENGERVVVGNIIFNNH